MPIGRLDTFGTISSAAWCLRLEFRVKGNLVHIGIVYLDFYTHKLITLLFHGFIDHSGVLKLHMCEVAPHMPVTASHLYDFATVLEKVLQLLLFWFLVNPANPNGLAAFWLLWPVWFPPTSRL